VPVREQRKTPRYDLKLPFELIRTGSKHVGKLGETRNLSSGGVLFTTDADVHVGQPIEFVITLQSSEEGACVQLRCMGKVIRIERKHDSVKPPLIAATVERFEFMRTR